jgi:hypothetical protein
MSEVNCEATITNSEAVEVMNLIKEYLHQGGTGFDDDKLERVLYAFEWADRIVIESEK